MDIVSISHYPSFCFVWLNQLTRYKYARYVVDCCFCQQNMNNTEDIEINFDWLNNLTNRIVRLFLNPSLIYI